MVLTQLTCDMLRLLPLIALSACVATAHIQGTRLPVASSPSVYFVLPVVPPEQPSRTHSRKPWPVSTQGRCWCDHASIACEVVDGQVRATWALRAPSDLPLVDGRAAACTDGESSWWARVTYTQSPPQPWWRSDRALVVPSLRDTSTSRVITLPSWIPSDARAVPAAADAPVACTLREAGRALTIDLRAPVKTDPNGAPCLTWKDGEIRAHALVYRRLDGSEIP
jgi:hypothetical protein